MWGGGGVISLRTSTREEGRAVSWLGRRTDRPGIFSNIQPSVTPRPRRPPSAGSCSVGAPWIDGAVWGVRCPPLPQFNASCAGHQEVSGVHPTVARRFRRQPAGVREPSVARRGRTREWSAAHATRGCRVMFCLLHGDALPPSPSSLRAPPIHQSSVPPPPLFFAQVSQFTRPFTARLLAYGPACLPVCACPGSTYLPLLLLSSLSSLCRPQN